jgi:hypothetical protein
MWQAPVIMIAAQAFLLQVLADDGIDLWARLIVLIAGVMAAFAAACTLLRGHAREVLFSEAVAVYLDRFGLPGVRPYVSTSQGSSRRAAGTDAGIRLVDAGSRTWALLGSNQRPPACRDAWAPS